MNMLFSQENGGNNYNGINAFSSIMERIKHLKNIKFDIELSKILGIEQSAFSERRRRDSIPYKEIIDFARKEKVSLNWLFFEEGEEKNIEKSGHFFEILNKQLPLVNQINPEHIQMFLIKTRAMEPTLLLDDLLIILNDCQPETHGDGIYKIKVNGAKKMRRAHVLPGNKIKITADNWTEDTMVVDFMNHPDVEFLGKVIFYLRKIENVTRNDQEDNLLKTTFNGSAVYKSQY